MRRNKRRIPSARSTFESLQKAQARAQRREKVALALEACRAVVRWAEAPGEHGGNPYCKEFVRLACAVLQDEGKGLFEAPGGVVDQARERVRK